MSSCNVLLLAWLSKHSHSGALHEWTSLEIFFPPPENSALVSEEQTPQIEELVTENCQNLESF